jgi:hypothetical protein
MSEESYVYLYQLDLKQNDLGSFWLTNILASLLQPWLAFVGALSFAI